MEKPIKFNPAKTKIFSVDYLFSYLLDLASKMKKHKSAIN